MKNTDKWWQREIHSGWRQACGIVLIVLGLAGATFYYVEMFTLGQGSAVALSAPAPQAQAGNAVTASDISSVALSPAAGASAKPAVGGKVKLSTATESELETLPHIGPSKAKAILDYRTAHGFKSVDDLEKVKGIGTKTMDDLRPLVEL